MTSVHPLALASSSTSTSTPTTTSGSTTKPKGVPIEVPKNERRPSNFSLKTTNRALMTGFRDGGHHHTSRRKSSSASTHSAKSPLFLPHKADDYDVIGALPGFEQAFEADVNKLRIPDTRSLLLQEDDDEISGLPASKKKKLDRDGEGIVHSPPLSATVPKGRRKSSITPYGSPPNASQPLTFSSRPSIAASPPLPSTTFSIASSSSSSTSGAAQQRARLLSAPTIILSSGKVGERRDSLSSSNRAWPKIPISCVRVGPKTEFATHNTTLEFGPDRIVLMINGNITLMTHADLRLVEYYTASRVKIIQIVTCGKLSEKSILANYYDPTLHSGKARKIVLYTDEDESSVLGQCSKLKEKGVETKCLTPEAAEKLLTMNHRRVSPTRSSKHSPLQADETLFMFPFQSTGKSKSIAIRAEDVSRLDNGEFLNDTLIEFGLKYIHSNLEVKNAFLAGQVHIFNSFFYQRLLAKPSKGAVTSYDSVKSWTSKVDLFSMKYIIVPIHENLHWYLAIIVNPGLILQEAEQSVGSTMDTEEVTNLDIREQRDAIVDLGSPKVAEDAGTAMDVDGEKKPRTTASASPDPHTSSTFNAASRPFILCLDSMRGTHPTVFRTLRSYLQQELLTRKGISAPMTSKELVGKYSKSKTDDAAVWATSEIAGKREKYRDVMTSLQEKYKVYKFKRQFVEDLKENSSSHNDRRGSNTSESDVSNKIETVENDSNDIGLKDENGDSSSADDASSIIMTSTRDPLRVGLGLDLDL
ncbi:hypothetical protein BGZ83_000647 [Gryganskiella cystojenkinii]|nr:hypothetical protein BGZ83_000647 [Gryganskiella cystojenkinii]